ncbi:hypothetical protein [Streptomyces sp. McG3]|uniref:hypothetical protein n=1 Tax=Streptomyces sp. McG3 TaxID=2725483 RepID=UPI001BEC231E|nr:hypothetical protein [Streptomyces sp. McG3]MBT2900216.1 hypothetical protein [Streptomyces sp. McG3]
MASHIHGEDGCAGCEGSRSDVGHDWEERMQMISELRPNITKWFDTTYGPPQSTTPAIPSPAFDRTTTLRSYLSTNVAARQSTHTGAIGESFASPERGSIEIGISATRWDSP